MSDRYPQVMRFCGETPWAIMPSKLAVIQELLAIRASGHHLSPEEIQARIGTREPERAAPATGNVAVIPIYGTIIPKASMFSDISGGTSIQGLSEAFQAALADDSIGAILFDIDSPGGSTGLVPEFASEIREARGRKPIVAIGNTLAASAAYWLGASADEFVATPSALVGSIGVYAMHQDVSAAAEMEGVKTTLISAGRYKTEATPFEPLSDEARAAIQERVDETYGMFVDGVAEGRGVTASAVRSGFGEGRVVTASAGRKAGMIDGVATLEATVQRLIVAAAGGSGRRMAARGEPLRIEAGPPPGEDDDIETTPAAERGLSFAQTLSASRSSVEQATAHAVALRALTAVKRDDLVATSACWKAAADALDERVAEHDAGELTDEQLAAIADIQRSWIA